MANCTECKANIPDGAQRCPTCGKRVIAGDTLEAVPQKITIWQKFLIVLVTIILIVIGLTYQDAEDREVKAAQEIFAEPARNIISSAATQFGLAGQFGDPNVNFEAGPKSAKITLEFPRGTLHPRQAAIFGQTIAGALARVYVDKGYIPRDLTVTVASMQPDGSKYYYGTAIYNGNKDVLGWAPAKNK